MITMMMMDSQTYNILEASTLIATSIKEAFHWESDSVVIANTTFMYNEIKSFYI